MPPWQNDCGASGSSAFYSKGGVMEETRKSWKLSNSSSAVWCNVECSELFNSTHRPRRVCDGVLTDDAGSVAGKWG